MFVHTDRTGAELREADDCTRFEVVVAGDLTADELAGSLRPFGELDGDHVWIRVDALRAAAAGSVPDDWDDRFVAMLGYAASKGWLDDDGTAVRAHLVPAT